MRAVARLAVTALAVVAAACGQKGPPLAPLHLVPNAPGNVSVARAGDDARVRFDVPSTNQNGPGTVALDRIEVFAATVAGGAARPANRELLMAKYRVATISIKPPPVEGETAPANAPPDTRPSAGERSAFVEALTAEKLTPVFTTPPPKPAKPAAIAGTRPSLPDAVPGIFPGESTPIPVFPSAAQSQADLPAYVARIYAVRGVSKSGRPGPPSTRVELPLLPPPAAPPTPAATTTETSIVLTWTAPQSGRGVAYNIYKTGAVDPLNSAPVTEGKFERSGVEFGTEACFVVRALEKVAAASIESEASPAVCLTPRDTFPPAAPKGFSAVAGTGTISLSWDANAEPDIAGYLVLRGEAPGDTLQPLMPAPMPGTSYEDKTVKPGVRYVYAIVAVDKASPPNRSAPSARIEETAR